MPNQRNVLYLLLIGVLVGGLLTGRAFFFNLALILFALYALSLVYAWTSVRWLAIGRKTRTRRAQVGRKLEESFSIRNRTLLPKLWVEVRDESTLPGHRASHVVPTLGPFGRYEWKADTICRVRGDYQLGPVTVIGGDPFGLFSARRTLDARSRILVYPDTRPISSFELPIGLLSGGEAQRRRAATTTSSAAGVREYVSGDSFNRIHWASTARRDQLMVKEFEIDPLVDVWLFVDFSAASLAERPGLKRVNGNGPVIPRGGEIPACSEEYAVTIAASLARHFLDKERALASGAGRRPQPVALQSRPDAVVGDAIFHAWHVARHHHGVGRGVVADRGADHRAARYPASVHPARSGIVQRCRAGRARLAGQAAAGENPLDSGELRR